MQKKVFVLIADLLLHAPILMVSQKAISDRQNSKYFEIICM